ncbi:unnamed protein product [Gongylonema pulchrum]|nr:unnamed protein product [Gongylonema pulchrum]
MGERREMKVAHEAQKDPNKKINVEGKSELDAVMSLRTAEAVANRALEACKSEKSALLLSFWRITKRYGVVAKRLTTQFYEKLWTPEYKSEESWIAKSELISYVSSSFYASRIPLLVLDL